DTHVDIRGIHQPCTLVVKVAQFAGELSCFKEQTERLAQIAKFVIRHPMLPSAAGSSLLASIAFAIWNAASDLSIASSKRPSASDSFPRSRSESDSRNESPCERAKARLDS